MKIRLDNIFDSEDLKLLTKSTKGKVKCPHCKKLWLSPYPKTRQLCPDCFFKLTGLRYIE